MSILELHNISLRFGGVVALDDVSLNVPAGMTFGLIGPNGAGKTTLVNVISGLIPPNSGSMVFDGRKDGPWPIATSVGYGIVRTFQQTRAFLGLTVRENLRIAAAVSPQPEMIGDLVDACGLAEVMDRTASELPYAALRHLGIALALALRPRLLLLDEPAVGLSGDELERLGHLIRRWMDAGITILLIEHNVRFLMDLSDRVAVLDRGRLLFEGTPEECQSNPDVINTYLGRGGSDVEH
ncbi:ABC transporter ATP-binding protein [Nitratireductor kimnyeongensis]|uniref:ABC transporter ATP-binding protein n=1 Tax=Nitratireductor kimnyeongensis TaxID=430679 RepID=A0ABW0T4T2_9HYPH|nr:ATP-binding cassette domain-containing protein [Nitratireductor kimnyeongensis]QZZ37424.1 ATP-binding cassette domain-containing protein [Nitratireductor kimnyeongensis]